jgi:hypothetical protein
MKKTLLLVIGVFILCVSTAVYAQDLCQKMHDRYRICIEKQDAGKNMDYDM